MNISSSLSSSSSSSSLSSSSSPCHHHHNHQLRFLTIIIRAFGLRVTFSKVSRQSWIATHFYWDSRVESLVEWLDLSDRKMVSMALDWSLVRLIDNEPSKYDLALHKSPSSSEWGRPWFQFPRGTRIFFFCDTCDILLHLSYEEKRNSQILIFFISNC